MFLLLYGSLILEPFDESDSSLWTPPITHRYWNRWVPWALQFGDVETLARSHNGGTSYHRAPKTKRYWSKVRAFLYAGALLLCQQTHTKTLSEAFSEIASTGAGASKLLQTPTIPTRELPLQDKHDKQEHESRFTFCMCFLLDVVFTIQTKQVGQNKTNIPVCPRTRHLKTTRNGIFVVSQ